MKPVLREVCASCLQPVYCMERVATDKVCVHHSCFCCQVCRRQLSLQNYAALHGSFYCQVHYKQMAATESTSQMQRLQHWLGEQQLQNTALAGRGPQPQDWYHRAKKETAAGDKPTAFSARCSWWLAEPRQDQSSSYVLLGNQLRAGWRPSETTCLDTCGKVGNLGACSWKKPILSQKSCRAVGSRAGKMVLQDQDRISAAEVAMEKGRLLPGFSYTKKQVCSWPKISGQRASEKTGDGDMLKEEQGTKVAERVAAIQQGQAQLKKRLVSASSPLVLKPVKSLPQGSFVPHTTWQSTKPTNWMYLRGTDSFTPSAAQLPVKEDEVCESVSTDSKGGTMSAMTDDKPDLTIATPAIAGDSKHLGGRTKSTQPICVPGEPKHYRNITNTELKCSSEGADPPESANEEAHCLSEASRTPHVSSDSLEPAGLSVSPMIADLVKEKSKVNTNESLENEILVSLGENVKPHSTSHLPAIESKGAALEKMKEVKPISTSGFLEDPSPEHRPQKTKAEKSRVSSPGLPGKTDDHSVSCLQESEPQGMCGSLISNSNEVISRPDTKPPGKGFPVSTDTPPRGACATWPSRDEDGSKSKDPRKVQTRNTFHDSEQPAKILDSSKTNTSWDKPSSYPVSEEKWALIFPGESSVYPSRPGAHWKENQSGQACREVLGKGFRSGEKPFSTLFGSEDRGSAPKNGTTQRKPTKPQSALLTLFGYSSEKKQSQPEKPARSSEQTNTDRPEKPQDLLSFSNQAKQKAPKTDQLPKPGKMEVFPKPIKKSSEGFLVSAEGKETNIPLLAPATNISCADKLERTELDIHDQMPLNTQFWQQWNSCWTSIMPAQEIQKEAAVTSESGINSLHPPSELIPAADNSKSLIREILLEIQSPLRLNVQDTVMEEEVSVLPGNSEKLPKEAELQSDHVNFVEDSSLLSSGGQDFHSTGSKTLPSDLENSELEPLTWFDANLSELCQEIPAETKPPLALWNTSSLSLPAGQEEMTTEGPEGIQSCVLQQQLDPRCQAPKAAEDTFEFGLSAEGSTKKCFSAQEDSFPPMHVATSHAPETFNRGVFDPFDTDLSKMGQGAPEEMNRSREASGVEEDYESHSSADPDVLADGPVDQEFFV